MKTLVRSALILLSILWRSSLGWTAPCLTSFPNPDERSDCKKKWTVLIFMAADNDLAPYALWDLYEMEAGARIAEKTGSSLRTDVVVQLDLPDTEGWRRIHIRQNPLNLFDPNLGKTTFETATIDSLYSPVIGTLPEKRLKGKNNHNPKNELKNFLKWGMTKFPAENYLVVIWGHGQGWTSETGARNFGGLAFDQSQGTYLDILSLEEALRETKNEMLDGSAISVYASDACLMQSLEVASQIAPHARFVVGSSQIQNFMGLPYRKILIELNRGWFGSANPVETEDEAYLLARRIPVLLEQAMEQSGYQGRHDPSLGDKLTMSALASDSLLDGTLPELKLFSQLMIEYLNEDPLRGIAISDLIQSTPGFMGGGQDLGAFLWNLETVIEEDFTQLLAPSEIARQLFFQTELIRSQLELTVINRVFGSYYASNDIRPYLMGMKGVSLWFPKNSRDYYARIADFEKSRFYQETGWNQWLQLLY